MDPLRGRWLLFQFLLRIFWSSLLCSLLGLVLPEEQRVGLAERRLVLRDEAVAADARGREEHGADREPAGGAGNSGNDKGLRARLVEPRHHEERKEGGRRCNDEGVL